jgi:hypothetical protein
MRLLGIVLVVVGALALGVHGFGSVGRGPGPGGAARPADETGWMSPVVAGIAVVGGLLLLVSDGRRD